MSKRLDGIIIGCKDKTSSWHLIGFPNGSNIGSTLLLLTYIQRIACQPEKTPSKVVCMYVCVCVCVFSSHSFWTSMDVPAGVTQEEGNTGFSIHPIHLLSAVLALMFLARRIQPFLSLVDREAEFCVLTISSFSTRWVFLFSFFSFSVRKICSPGSNSRPNVSEVTWYL